MKSNGIVSPREMSVHACIEWLRVRATARWVNVVAMQGRLVVADPIGEQGASPAHLRFQEV